jgi:hypothetical protein
MPVTIAGPPVNWLESPVNSPGPRTTMVQGRSPDSSMISTEPDSMTSNARLLSPASKSLSPSRYRSSFVNGHRPSETIWDPLSLGNAAAFRSFSGIVSSPVRSGLWAHRR